MSEAGVKSALDVAIELGDKSMIQQLLDRRPAANDTALEARCDEDERLRSAAFDFIRGHLAALALGILIGVALLAVPAILVEWRVG